MTTFWPSKDAEADDLQWDIENREIQWRLFNIILEADLENAIEAAVNQ